MDQKSFYSRLAIITAGVSVLLFALCRFAPQAQMHGYFSAATVILFLLVCMGLYYAGANAARARNKHAFTNLVSVSVFGKMALAVAYLFLYQKVMQPANEWYVGIFLLCYVVYTVFEVSFMSRLARM